ncbi:hypothetical protein ACFQFC_36980 [Amorphoplanes digitatis]|uniref:Uncharacterized protein n=1 Tax=Actinoplanes digitatis TaxID=1868 RepID=A0A7W7HVY9_9ACTN|nr:hypothetical protein [Actinoplanes digitatis]MBB4761755.1 hypothetical protein [Actinoplanes digitatis]GID90866.1 hypothetical protein Adi01nite_02780 [Actinoplanes digitatis]
MAAVNEHDVRDIAAGYDADPARSMSLHAAAYTDPMWFDLDLRAVIGRTWQWVCHVEKLRAPGSYVSATAAAPLAAQAPDLAAEIAFWAPDVADLTFARRLTYEVRSNDAYAKHVNGGRLSGGASPCRARPEA